MTRKIVTRKYSNFKRGKKCDGDSFQWFLFAVMMGLDEVWVFLDDVLMNKLRVVNVKLIIDFRIRV